MALLGISSQLNFFYCIVVKVPSFQEMEFVCLMICSVIFSTVNGSNLVVLFFKNDYIVLFCFCIFTSPQESKKHLAGLGTLGLGSLITEITASEEDDRENRDSGSVDAEGEDKYIIALQCRQKLYRLTIFTMYCLIQVG